MFTYMRCRMLAVHGPLEVEYHYFTIASVKLANDKHNVYSDTGGRTGGRYILTYLFRAAMLFLAGGSGYILHVHLGAGEVIALGTK